MHTPCTKWQVVVFQFQNLSSSLFGVYEERKFIKTGPLTAFTERPFG